MILSAVQVRSHMELQEQVDDLLATINHNGYHLRDFLEPEEIAECITQENGKDVVQHLDYMELDIGEWTGSNSAVDDLEGKIEALGNAAYRHLCFAGAVKNATSIEEVQGIVKGWEDQAETIDNSLAERLAHAENALNAIARSTKSKAILSIISSYRSKTA